MANCSAGSRCVECNQTHFYCDQSCNFQNGGCPAGSNCTEVIDESCDIDNECCSHFEVICSSKFKISIQVIANYVYFIVVQYDFLTI